MILNCISKKKINKNKYILEKLWSQIIFLEGISSTVDPLRHTHL